MKQTPFSSVLVANRGEIAVRIMRSVRASGRRVIGVATEVDRNAPHARFADQTVMIGKGAVGESYLSIETLLAAAQSSGAEAIHPGYGFLSENPDFARACRTAGLVFIGPSSDAIKVMGDKAAAKTAMQKAGVPCVPGYQGKDQSTATLAANASDIGYPVMIKAARGGGGRGMRLVNAPDEFKDALDLAKAEALGAFGSDAVILEHAIVKPRHVEVQIIADRAGHTIHLGDRDCSIQRRHQKIIEEAPAPGVSDDLRRDMGEAAVNAAKAIGYEGAGTVEFLLGQDGAFHFLEMNTRLQVEHPVTESVTGLDLVALQLDMAAGQPLAIAQKDVKISGHAIEARLYAENPQNGFLPASGRIERFDLPKGTGIRCDSGVEAGQKISSFYDPMLAKVIAHGEDRDSARRRLVAALGQTALFGPATNRDFLIDVLRDDGFAHAIPDTGFVEGFLSAPGAFPEVDPVLLIAAAAALYHSDSEDALRAAPNVPRELLGFGSPGVLNSRFVLTHDGTTQGFGIETGSDGRLAIALNGQRVSAENREDAVLVNGQRIPLTAFSASRKRVYMATPRRVLVFDRARAAKDGGIAARDGDIRAPMHGTLSEILVRKGDRVEAGTTLAILEAMKMQHEIVADSAGVVAGIKAVVGEQVHADRLLMVIEPVADA